MNLEAAKAVKYGRLSETEALKFVTLNPAKQLGIDKWVGSLEVGKDADLAIWSTILSITGPCVSRLGLTDDCITSSKEAGNGKEQIEGKGKIGCPCPQIPRRRRSGGGFRGSEGKILQAFARNGLRSLPSFLPLSL